MQQITPLFKRESVTRTFDPGQGNPQKIYTSDPELQEILKALQQGPSDYVVSALKHPAIDLLIKNGNSSLLIRECQRCEESYTPGAKMYFHYRSPSDQPFRSLDWFEWSKMISSVLRAPVGFVAPGDDGKPDFGPNARFIMVNPETTEKQYREMAEKSDKKVKSEYKGGAALDVYLAETNKYFTTYPAILDADNKKQAVSQMSDEMVASSIKQLGELLQSGAVRQDEVLNCLGKLSKRSPAALSYIANALLDEDNRVTVSMYSALRPLGRDVRTILPQLTRAAIANTDDTTRVACLSLLTSLEPRNPAIIDAHIGAYRTEQQLGREPTNCIHELFDCLERFPKQLATHKTLLLELVYEAEKRDNPLLSKAFAKLFAKTADQSDVEMLLESARQNNRDGRTASRCLLAITSANRTLRKFVERQVSAESKDFQDSILPRV